MIRLEYPAVTLQFLQGQQSERSEYALALPRQPPQLDASSPSRVLLCSPTAQRSASAATSWVAHCRPEELLHPSSTPNWANLGHR